MKEKIGIFGGTFNPVHNGHINLCKSCFEKYNFDKLLLIPTNIPPHKSASKLASGEDRLNMLTLAAKAYDFITPCDIELLEKSKSYTYLTIKKLAKLYPNGDFYLIIGSDMLFTFNQWKNYKTILGNVTIIAGARRKGEVSTLLKKRENFGDLALKIEIILLDEVEISSTDIRERVYNNEKIGDLVPCLVEGYIKEKGLYQREMD